MIYRFSNASFKGDVLPDGAALSFRVAIPSHLSHARNVAAEGVELPSDRTHVVGIEFRALAMKVGRFIESRGLLTSFQRLQVQPVQRLEDGGDLVFALLLARPKRAERVVGSERFSAARERIKET